MNRSLVQVITDGARVIELPQNVGLVSRGRHVPQVFVSASDQGVELLRNQPGVVGVRPADLLPVKLAEGIDRLLTFAFDHSAAAPNGWGERIDHRDKAAVSRRPVLSHDPPEVRWDDVIEPTPPVRLVSIVISKEPPEFASEPGPADPVGVASLAATGFDPYTDPAEDLGTQVERLSSAPGPVICMAAGNGGPGRLSPWAALGWVVGVGGSDDPEGTSLATTSATGEGAQTGPELVAWGASALDADMRGTSFAAPRVAHCTAVLWAFAETVAELALRYVIGGARGIPLAAIGIVDDGQIPRAPLQLPRYPLAGVNEEAVSRACERLISAGIAPQPRVTGGAVRRLLTRSALPRDTAGWGHGFVSDESTLNFCRAASAAELVSVIAPYEPELEASLLRDLSEIRLAKHDEIELATQVWSDAIAVLHVHQDSQVMTVA